MAMYWKNFVSAFDPFSSKEQCAAAVQCPGTRSRYSGLKNSLKYMFGKPTQTQGGTCKLHTETSVLNPANFFPVRRQR